MDLFAEEPAARPPTARPRPAAPLADRMRPRSLDEVVGQELLVGPGRVLRAAIEAGQLHSMILWGPPGSGKTTLASLMADVTGGRFVAFSAVLSGVKEIREVIAEAERARAAGGARTVLFVDEIHRFNRAQQDAFLPHVERGTIVLIGATTENPSFEVNSALLSRCRVYVLQPLDEGDLATIMRRALADPERGLARSRPDVAEPALRLIARLANGDARTALNILELAVTLAPLREGRRTVTETGIREAAQRRTLLYDKSGEEHYNLISALHKSLRDSDPDASLYWLTRMLEAGEDRLYIARRLVRFASEDVGNADPSALALTLAAKDAYDFLGSPEGELALAQATLYLALAPKSNAVYVAFDATTADVHERPAEPVPLHIRNAPTRLMKSLGYGAGYQYAHDAPGARVDQDDLPEALRGRAYYRPTDRGLEAELGRRLADWRAWRRRAQAQRPGGSPEPEGDPGPAP
jgi:putative ATPase